MTLLKLFPVLVKVLIFCFVSIFCYQDRLSKKEYKSRAVIASVLTAIVQVASFDIA